LVQMLQAEDEIRRLLLVEALGQIYTPYASTALAERSLYDLSPEVREAAVLALQKRDRSEFREKLLDGFRHPWPRVADHAAEALVALRDQDSIKQLRELRDKPAPTAPLATKAEGKTVVRELVRTNHLRNCLLCHAPAYSDKDLVLGPVPTPGKPLPFEYYGARRSEGDTQLVRADVTYFRQDFSIMQRVDKAAPWPEQQRFDFLVRTREATAAELEAAQKPPATYPQREAVLWAIAELEKVKAPPPGK
jgi:hypothetical protein